MLLANTTVTIAIAAIAAGTPAAPTVPGSAIYPPTPRHTYFVSPAKFLDNPRETARVREPEPVYVRHCHIPLKKRASDRDPPERCTVTVIRR